MSKVLRFNPCSITYVDVDVAPNEASKERLVGLKPPLLSTLLVLWVLFGVRYG